MGLPMSLLGYPCREGDKMERSEKFPTKSLTSKWGVFANGNRNRVIYWVYPNPTNSELKWFASTFIILGEHHDFHDFLCFYLVVFLVHSYVFLRVFSGAVFPFSRIFCRTFSGVFW